ncbi:hypothetical protein [Oceanibaculum sp.]|uniref:hypothetical protein n=1 Tax=Oceanibaculum sp. TaxID=1903597 RepID=UPI002586FE1E|nr:hypothetical protein [Oceanibaculum sp.]MCH2394190.1 hypothetical protein [Oceanibaculum sp.]
MTLAHGTAASAGAVAPCARSRTNLIPLCRACHKRVETVFHDVEAVDPPLPVTKLVLFCSIHARRTVTLHMLKSSAHADHRPAA